MKLIEFNFNDIHVKGISIFIDDNHIITGYIGEVLKQIPHLSEYEIKSTNVYFDEFVIRLHSKTPEGVEN